MRLGKFTNYKFDKVELENEIERLEKDTRIRDTELKKNLIRKNKSEIDEFPILKSINDNRMVKSVKYVRDYTEKYKTDRMSMSIDEVIDNETNMKGTDLYVLTRDSKLYRIDVKVLEYDPIHRKTNKIMNGKLVDDKWGMENFIFQVEGMWNEKGWANKSEKITDVLVILVKATNKIYSFDYKKLCKWLNDKLDNKEITEKDYIVFDKVWDKYRNGYKTRECVVSIPCNEIPFGIWKSIGRVDTIEPRQRLRETEPRRIRQRLI